MLSSAQEAKVETTVAGLDTKIAKKRGKSGGRNSAREIIEAMSACRYPIG